MNKKGILAALACALCLPVAAQDGNDGKEAGGKAIIAIYTDLHSGFGSRNNDRGFTLDRSYLGYQYSLKNGLEFKAVMDVGQSDDVHDYERIAYIKNAQVTWRHKGLTLSGGLISTTQFKTQESFWGKRYVMRSFQDEYKFGSSADMGISVAYKFTPWLSADVIVANGEGYKKVQVNDGLQYGAGVTVTPLEGLTLRAYASYNEAATDEGEGITNWNVFAGYAHRSFSIGAEYNAQANAKNIKGQDQSGCSVYSTIGLDKKGNKLFTIEKVRSTEDFADPAIYASISAQRINKKIILISQDKQLADDVRNLNNLDSQRGKFVNVYKVDPYGDLLENKGNVYQNQARSSVRSSRNLPSKIPEKNIREVQPLPRQTPKKEEPKPLVPLDIKALDRAISSNIHNSTYPLARKLDDLDRQLKNLGPYSASDISSWKLLYGPDDLLKAKAEVIALQEKSLEEKPVSSEKEAKPASQSAAPAPKARPDAKPAPAPEAPKKRAPFGKGDTFISALKDLLGRYGTMIRDDEVPYVAAVHGPHDLVNSDFSKLVHEVALLEAGSKKDATVKKLLFHIEKNQGDYRVTLEEAPKAEPVKAPSTPPKEASPKKEAPSGKGTAQKKGPQASPKTGAPKTDASKATANKPHPGRKAVHSPSYEQALATDRDLMAKINNPSYHLECKLRDLKAQEALVRTLKQSELKDLNYTVRGLQKAIRDLKSSSK